MSLASEVTGLEPELKRIMMARIAYERALVQGIRVEAELVMTESQKEVPRDTGELANSRYVKDAKNQLGTEIGYRAEYALFVHEARSDTNFRVGKRKFLEDPAKRATQGYADRLGRRVKRLAEAMLR